MDTIRTLFNMVMIAISLLITFGCGEDIRFVSGPIPSPIVDVPNVVVTTVTPVPSTSPGVSPLPSPIPSPSCEPKLKHKKCKENKHD